MTKAVDSTNKIGVIAFATGFGSGKSIIALMINLYELKHNLKEEDSICIVMTASHIFTQWKSEMRNRQLCGNSRLLKSLWNFSPRLISMLSMRVMLESQKTCSSKSNRAKLGRFCVFSFRKVYFISTSLLDHARTMLRHGSIT